MVIEDLVREILLYGKQMSLGTINPHQVMKLGQVNHFNIRFIDIHMLWLVEIVCISYRQNKIVYIVYHRFEHCGAQSLWKVVPHYLRRVNDALKKVWVFRGGEGWFDRDGNSNVTAIFTVLIMVLVIHGAVNHV
ncbi:putative phosphoenolpyruvate carboxylase [Rosa chinensis]|uniref:Putative phosphoenolpyruvate carboxylase n=1 Tax=Rosa chinensis TaxID=74649 RepID=A0A2P6QBA7_ROSCH|nr:putative phosphoenolpyruvate carboxylase [Rosa chinensis]